MAKTEGEQNIPSEYMYPYEAVLRPQGVLGKMWVYMRYPFGLPTHRKGAPGVSAKQVAHRIVFEKCVKCYNCQPYTGSPPPYTFGARNRSWWFDDAVGSGMWYYNWFMHRTLGEYLAGWTPDWCMATLDGIQRTNEQDPDKNHRYMTNTVVGYNRWFGNYTWLKRGEQNFVKLYILAYSNNPGSIPHTGITLKIHKQLVDWDISTLTWNNQPELGEQIGTFAIPYEAWPKQYEIPIPTDHDKFCITAGDGSDDTNWIGFYVRNSGITDGVAFMGG